MKKKQIIENIGEPPASREAQLDRALSELFEDFGESLVVSAILASPELNSDKVKKALSDSRIIRALKSVIMRISGSKTPRLEADSYLISIGMISDGDTITRIAYKHGITKQAISKRVIELCDELGLEPSVLMRSEAVRDVYAATNRPSTQAPKPEIV